MYCCAGDGLGSSQGSNLHYDDVNGSPWSWAVAKLSKCRWQLRFLFVRERNQDDFTSSSRSKFRTQGTYPGQLLPQSIPESLGRPLQVDLSGSLYRATHMHHFTSSLPPSIPSISVMSSYAQTSLTSTFALGGVS